MDRHFLFEDSDIGMFIVGASTEEEAQEIALGVSEAPYFVEEVDDDWAEASGLDEF